MVPVPTPAAGYRGTMTINRVTLLRGGTGHA